MLKRLCLALVLLLLPAAALADVVISEVMASNGVYDNGESYDWVELHNDGSKTVEEEKVVAFFDIYRADYFFISIVFTNRHYY